MKKYRCPKCKTEFTGKLEHCPNCGIELHYIDEEVKKEVKAPVASFHYDDNDILNKGIEEDPNEKEQEEATKKPTVTSHFGDYPEAGAKVDSFGNYLSYYDGNAFTLFLILIGATLMTLCSGFLLLPWAVCIYYRYDCKHTIICGRRLKFDGKGIQLFGRYLLWLLLTIITAGIFSIFLSMRIRKWKLMHTKFESVIINTGE